MFCHLHEMHVMDGMLLDMSFPFLVTTFQTYRLNVQYLYRSFGNSSSVVKLLHHTPLLTVLHDYTCPYPPDGSGKWLALGHQRQIVNLLLAGSLSKLFHQDSYSLRKT